MYFDLKFKFYFTSNQKRCDYSFSFLPNVFYLFFHDRWRILFTALSPSVLRYPSSVQCKSFCSEFEILETMVFQYHFSEVFSRSVTVFYLVRVFSKYFPLTVGYCFSYTRDPPILCFSLFQFVHLSFRSSYLVLPFKAHAAVSVLSSKYSRNPITVGRPCWHTLPTTDCRPPIRGSASVLVIVRQCFPTFFFYRFTFFFLNVWKSYAPLIDLNLFWFYFVSQTNKTLSVPISNWRRMRSNFTTHIYGQSEIFEITLLWFDHCCIPMVDAVSTDRSLLGVCTFSIRNGLIYYGLYCPNSLVVFHLTDCQSALYFEDFPV